MSFNPQLIDFVLGQVGFAGPLLTVSYYLLGFETAQWVFSLLPPPDFRPVFRQINTISGNDAVIVSHLTVCQLSTGSSVCIVSELRYQNRVEHPSEEKPVASGVNNFIIVGNGSWRSQ